MSLDTSHRTTVTEFPAARSGGYGSVLGRQACLGAWLSSIHNEATHSPIDWPPSFVSATELVLGDSYDEIRAYIYYDDDINACLDYWYAVEDLYAVGNGFVCL